MLATQYPDQSAHGHRSHGEPALNPLTIDLVRQALDEEGLSHSIDPDGDVRIVLGSFATTDLVITISSTAIEREDLLFMRCRAGGDYPPELRDLLAYLSTWYHRHYPAPRAQVRTDPFRQRTAIDLDHAVDFGLGATATQVGYQFRAFAISCAFFWEVADKWLYRPTGQRYLITWRGKRE